MKRATIFDIFIVSFFVLPIAASQWITVLDYIDVNRTNGLIAMVVFYVGSVTFLMEGARRTKRYEVAQALIRVYLQAKTSKLASFKRIRESIDLNYDDDFLTGLIKKYPEVFKSAKVKKKGPGIKLVELEDKPEEEDYGKN